MDATGQGAPANPQWEPQPEAAALVGQLVTQCCASNRSVGVFASRLHAETGTRLIDWVDTLEAPDDGDMGARLAAAGFVRGKKTSVWRNARGHFPAIRLVDDSDLAALQDPSRIWIKLELVDEFIAKERDFDSIEVHGSPGSQLRYCVLPASGGVQLIGVERHGTRGYTVDDPGAQQLAAANKHVRSFAQRPREGKVLHDGYQQATSLFDAAAADLGRDWACDLFFAAERSYWMSRNHAARVQYDRQQKLGLGWANHDHHTYRSSRAKFHRLIEALEHMGFVCRERFYAGNEAGWGAQVLEQQECGLVVFADVDLSPDEVAGDFAHEGLQPRQELGTVGLWCALHGESFLRAGLHHLECQFDFDAVRSQLAELDIETMTPFTDWPHLKQAFTKGEVWQVDPRRIAALEEAGQVSTQQAEQFRRDGALGSHLEVLERNDGYKGFNQTGVSDIIARTDPRNW